MKEIGKFLQLSVKSSSLVAAASHSLSVNCKHTLERSFHLSLFLSCLHLLSPHSSSSFFLLYSFYHWFLPFFLIFSVSNNTAFNLTFLSPLPSVILIFPLHIFSPNIFLPPLKPHSSLFIFSLDHILFPLTTPYTHFIPQHGSNACGLQIRLYLASLLGLLLILYL